MALFLVDSEKMQRAGFDPKKIKMVREKFSAEADQQEYYISAEHVQKLLGINEAMANQLIRTDKLPPKQGPRTSKFYDVREIIKCYYKSLHEEDLDKKIKRQKELKLRIENNASLGEFVRKDVAEDRVVVLLQALQRMITYTIKTSASLVCACPSARAAEKILNNNFGDCYKMLEQQVSHVEWSEEKSAKMPDDENEKDI